MIERDRRDLGGVRLSSWGSVVRTDDPAVPYLLVGPGRVAVEPVRQFLRDFAAQGCSPSSVRSYAYVLLRWWRWLLVIGVEWNRATPAEVRDFVLWLQLASKPGRPGPTVDRNGAVNPITRKRLLNQRYQPRTVRHSNAVVRSFYEHWIDEGAGPLINPMQLARGRTGGARRAHAHQNPLEPFGPGARLRYNPRVPKSTPRAMSDERWSEVFGGLRSHRDRALLALAVSNGARASELLGMRLCDVDWGEQKIRVVRKGSRAEQWLPASAEAFVWLHLYLAALGSPLGPDEQLWWTLRRRERGSGLVRQPLTYDALRAVLRRVNAMLETNWSMHDLRHTAGLRMARDPALTLRDVQVILGHAHLSTTADVYLIEEEDAVIRRVLQHLAEVAERRSRPPAPALPAAYDATDLAVLFGAEVS